MKKRRILLFFGVALSAVVLFEACRNPIMERWWEEREHSPTTPEGKSGANFGFVFFDANGGEPQPRPLRVLYGNQIPRLRAMTNIVNGRHQGFAGWFDEQGNQWNFETRQLRKEDDADEDGIITLRAKWSPAAYTVSFVTNFEQLSSPPLNQYGQEITVDDQHVIHGGSVIEPPVMPTGDGHGLVGWFLSNGHPFHSSHDNDSLWGRQWNFANDTVTDRIILYARWSMQTRTVHLQVNGGTRPDGQAISRLNFTVHTGTLGDTGGKIIDPGPIAREGYTFGGWFTDGLSFTNRWDFATGKVQDVDVFQDGFLVNDPFTLYAKWVPNIYIVSFSAGEVSNPASQEIQHGERVTAPELAQNHGRSLVGWFTADGGQWNFNTDAARSTMTLYARWEEATVFAKFHLGGLEAPGSQLNPVFRAPEEQQLRFGSRVSEPFMPALPVDKIESDWSFYAWYYHPSFGAPGATLADINTRAFREALEPWDFNRTINNDLNLFARWVPPVPGMVWVPRGSFVMGDSGVSGSPAIHHAYPTRLVTVDGFYISRTQVTQAQYREIMLTREMSGIPVFDNSLEPSNTRGDSNPVERVSWFDAIYYAILRTRRDGLNQVLEISDANTAFIPPTNNLRSINSAAVKVLNWNADGFRLPTEAEWEFAARGGHGSPGNFVYAGSNSAEAVAWFNATSSSRTQPVGGKQANALGIYDMSGNVSEWTWDALLSYRDIQQNVNNPRINGNLPDVDNAVARVRRGGGWSNTAANVRSVVRNSDTPDTAHWAIGFRVVRGPSTSNIW